MVIVKSGKVVLGLDVYSPGDAIEGLTDAAEKKLVALGLAAKEATESVERRPAEAKEPTKDELVAKCRELGLSARGSKAELKARIDEFESGSAGEPDEEPEAEDDEPPALTAEVPR